MNGLLDVGLLLSSFQIVHRRTSYDVAIIFCGPCNQHSFIAAEGALSRNTPTYLYFVMLLFYVQTFIFVFAAMLHVLHCFCNRSLCFVVNVIMLVRRTNKR